MFVKLASINQVIPTYQIWKMITSVLIWDLLGAIWLKWLPLVVYSKLEHFLIAKQTQ